LANKPAAGPRAAFINFANSMAMCGEEGLGLFVRMFRTFNRQREVQKGASHFVAQNDKIDKPIIAVKLTNPVNRFTNGSVAGKEHRAGQQFCHFFTLYRLADQSIMCAGRQTPSHLLLVNPEFCGLMPHRRRCKMFHCFGWLP